MRIYLDNAAATPIDSRVIKEMIWAMKLEGNPSSFNDAGRVAREEIEKARLSIARYVNARPEEIIFTASGSEANNLAIFGITAQNKSGHIISTQIEHPSILEPLKSLPDNFKVDLVGVDSEGFVNPEDIRKLLRKDTILVSVMYANNEIGTIEPIREISKALRGHKSKSILHIDACQATGYLNMNVHDLGVDMMTFNGSKIYGPRGIGVLYIKRGLDIVSHIKGGGQERGRRAGTEHTAAILGLAKALTLIDKQEGKRLTDIQEYFLSNIEIDRSRLNGPKEKRLPNNINISFEGVTSEEVLLQLDKFGICASSGSACTSHTVEPSHVLKAIEAPQKYLDGAIRISMGRQTTIKDIDYVLKILPKVIEKCRSLR